MKTVDANSSKSRTVKPLHLLLFSIAGFGLWLLAWNRVDHLRWAHQWKVLNFGGYAFQIGVILLLVMLGAACLSGPGFLCFERFVKESIQSSCSLAADPTGSDRNGAKISPEESGWEVPGGPERS